MRKFPHHRIVLFVSAIILAGLVGTGIYFYLKQNDLSKKKAENFKIGVMPFTNLTPNPDTDYLGLAFADEITKNLNLFAKINVTRINGQKSDENESLNQFLEKIRLKDKIDLVVIGNYSIAPNEITISAKMVNTLEKTTYYSKTFTILNKDISTIPQLVSWDLIRNLHLTTRGFLKNHSKPQNISEEVYKEYILLNRLEGRQTIEIIERLEKIIEKEPNFAEAWARLSWLYLDIASQGVNTSINYYQKGIEAAQKAKELSPENSDPAISLANLYLEIGEIEKALNEYKNLPEGGLTENNKLRLGFRIIRYGGLLDESIKMANQVKQNEPKLLFSAHQYYYLGDYEEYKKTITPQVNEPGWYSFGLGLVALYQKDSHLAQKHFTDATVFKGNTYIGWISQAFISQINGKTADGLKLLQKAEQKVNESKYFSGENLYYLVIANSYFGEKEAAIRVFKKAVDNGFFCYPYFERDPFLDKLRDNPEFQQILEIARQKHLRFKDIYYSN